MMASFHQTAICPIVIGRATELALLRLLVDRAKSGQGHVALLSGEAGIGKSRLVAEVKTYADSHDFRLLQGSCFPTDAAIPYAPLLDLLRSHGSSHALALPTTEIESIIETLLPDPGPVLVGKSPAATKSLLDPEQEKRRRFEVLTHFLIKQAETHPTLLVVEDLHWSDETSLEFLHYLARRCTAHRLLILLTYRSDERQSSLRHFLAYLNRERLAQECSLAPLTREEIEAMLHAIFALPRSIPLEMPNALYALTEGNPFFVEELLTSLLSVGDLVYTHGRWTRKPPSEWHIPRSVQDGGFCISPETVYSFRGICKNPHYERAGSGHSLVLLHGFTLNTQMWDDQFALFARHYQTIRYDMRRSGRSSLPTEEPFTAVDDLRVLLDVLGVHRTFVLGFSRGGSVAIAFALAYPERISALVLVDPTLCGWPWSDAFSESMHDLERTARTLGVKVAQQQWLAHPLFLPAQEQPEVAEHLAQMVANYTGWSWLYSSPEREFDLPEVRPLEWINVPTLLIIGERDIEEFQAIANHIVCTVPYLTKLIVSNVGHMTNMEAPKVFNQAVLRFLEDVEHHLE